MPELDRSVRLVLAGWAAFALMALSVAVVREDHRANMAVFILLAVAMAAWVARRGSRPSLVTSLVLGLLHTVEQVAYVIAGMINSAGPAYITIDLLGLASGLLLAFGSGQALRRRRREPTTVAA